MIERVKDQLKLGKEEITIKQEVDASTSSFVPSPKSDDAPEGETINQRIITKTEDHHAWLNSE